MGILSKAAKAAAKAARAAAAAKRATAKEKKKAAEVAARAKAAKARAAVDAHYGKTFTLKHVEESMRLEGWTERSYSDPNYVKSKEA